MQNAAKNSPRLPERQMPSLGARELLSGSCFGDSPPISPPTSRINNVAAKPTVIPPASPDKMPPTNPAAKPNTGPPIAPTNSPLLDAAHDQALASAGSIV